MCVMMEFYKCNLVCSRDSKLLQAHHDLKLRVLGLTIVFFYFLSDFQLAWKFCKSKEMKMHVLNRQENYKTKEQ